MQNKVKALAARLELKLWGLQNIFFHLQYAKADFLKRSIWIFIFRQLLFNDIEEVNKNPYFEISFSNVIEVIFRDRYINTVCNNLQR